MDRKRVNPPSPAGGGRRNLITGLGLLALVAGTMFWMYQQNRPRPVATDRENRTLAQEGVVPAQLGESWKEMDNAAKDGWDTEVTASATDKVLKQLGTWLTKPQELDAGKLEKYLGEQFACGALLPASLTTVFRDEYYHIERARPDKATPVSTSNETHRGAKGLVEALRTLTAPLQGAKDIHTKFKLFRIIPESADTFTTVQYFAYSGHVPDGMVEQNATWEMQWKLITNSSDPAGKTVKLQNIQVSDFELVRTKQKETLFGDCTASVLGKTACYKPQFLQGLNTWYERMQDKRYYYLLGNPGLAVGDVNGDGMEDLYVCQEEGLPNRLFFQEKDGSVKDVSEEWGVNWLHSSRSALFVDFDNDGKLDLAVAMVGHVVVCQNTGSKFEIKTILPTDGDNMSLAAADYDRDGRLDLYVCVYDRKAALEERFGDAQREGTRGVMLSANAIANNGIGGGRDALFHNDSKSTPWKFSNVTAEAGLEADPTMNRRYTFAACWEDYDNDGWLDLYLANDYGVNQLFKNEGGKFKEVSAAVNAQDDAFSMSASWADYDRDGWMDLYVGNMFSGAGNRITFQPKFLKDKDPDRKRRFQRFARGNTLLKNEGGKFKDVSDESGTTMGRWAWSCNFADVNNDGLEDLLVANGYITTEDTGDL